MFEFEQELADPERMSQRVAFHERLIAEETAAAAICDRVLTGPSRWWGKALDRTEGAKTAGMVAVLIERAGDILPSNPAAALDLAHIALYIGGNIDHEAYPYKHIVRLRGQALREKAFVLSYVGRQREAAAAAELAGVVLSEIPLPKRELARLDLVRSNIARNTEKFGDAIEYARRAATAFLELGSRVRWVKARNYEAAALFSWGRFGEARDVWRICEADIQLLDASDSAVVLYNLAISAMELGEHEEARHYLSKAAAVFEKLGHLVPSAKCRYCAARTLMADGSYREAIEEFRKSWHELDELGAGGDAVLPAIALVEALLVVGRTSEVPPICRFLIERCAHGDIPTGAMTALAYLREAVERGAGSASAARQVHDYMHDSACGEKAPFRAAVVRFEP
jgi:tetratricopeptide (TPR) repeat protein